MFAVTMFAFACFAWEFGVRRLCNALSMDLIDTMIKNIILKHE